MKAKRVDCFYCQNFDYVPYVGQSKCKLGKRVMFRLPTNIHRDNAGFFRYCNDYEK